MKYARLGRTDIEVSAVCMGGWSIVSVDGTWGRQDVDDSIAALRAALEAGVNFFDTAESYGDGESEEILARALGSHRREVVIASKVSPGHLEPAALRRHCEQSLRRLQTDYLDLYQVHWPNPHRPIAETLGVMEELKREGKIRAAGVSNFGVSYMRELLAAGRVESNQLAYSLLFRAIEHEVKPLCVANEVSVLCYSPLCQGLLTGKFRSADDVPEGRARTRLFARTRSQARHREPGCEDEVFRAIGRIREICQEVRLPMAQVALAWLLAQEGVTSVIAGARNPDQARQNAAAADIVLGGDVLSRLSAATQGVKDRIGKNADMWQTDSRMER